MKLSGGYAEHYLDIRYRGEQSIKKGSSVEMSPCLFCPEKHSPSPCAGSSMGQNYLKISNFKHQITNKPQIPIFNNQKLPERDIVWIFEFRLL
jgi:hypothetical protein